MKRLARWLLGLAVLWLVLSAPTRTTAQPATRLRIVMVLDASGSMVANDPARLVRTAAKMLADLADERDHVTVISFGSAARQLAAGSGHDHEALRAAIETLGRNESCTDYARALEAAAAAIPATGAPSERRVVLFLTDGRFEATRDRGGCVDFERASEAERASLGEAVDASIAKLRRARARVFAVGLGAAPARAAQSNAMLRKVATETGGRLVEAHSARDVPRLFAHIFGALVGAPVLQRQLDRAAASVDFEVPAGADRLHVVLVPQNPADLTGMRLVRRVDGEAQVPLEPPRVETGTPSGYQIGHVTDRVAGRYRLAGQPTGPVEVLVIPDVGLGLRFEGVARLLPEHDRLAGTVALRTRTGQPVDLAPDFLADVSFTVSLDKRDIFNQAPDRHGAAAFRAGGTLPRGSYVLRATAQHAHGLLDVPAVELPFVVMPQFELGLGDARATFDTMAEEGPIRVGPVHPLAVEVAAPPDLPADVRLTVTLPEGAARTDLRLEPTEITVGPGKPKRAELTLRWADPRALRGASRHYQGDILLSANVEDARLLTGAHEWRVPLDGKLRAWTWGRYLREYRSELAASLLGLLMLLWLVGRLVAAQFPEKARIHYVEVGQQFESDALLRRHARRGAYRSARVQFPLGKRAKPLATFRAAGRSFEVEPAPGVVVTVLDDALPAGDRERRKRFAGKWAERYRLADRYEVWLQRT